MSFLSHRLSHIKPSPTLAVAAKAAALKAQGHDIIDMGVGEPDFDTPQFIKDAAVQALNEGKTKYTAVAGTLALRNAIVNVFQQKGLTYTPNTIVVGVGAKQILFNAFLATLNPGDEVIIPSPYWVSYPDMVALAEGTPVIVPCPENQGFKLTPEALEAAITPRTKWLILNSPNNPTGMIYEAKELSALAEVLGRNPHVHVMSDDIYEHLVYDDFVFKTLAQIAPDLKERLLIVSGVSKSYAMTGWRIGYGAGSLELIKAITMLQSQSTSNACSIAQEAAYAALSGPQDFMFSWIATFEERRNQALTQLHHIPGFSCLTPQGAFYLYPSCAGVLGKRAPTGSLLENDVDVADFLLSEAGVAVIPGSAFGMSPFLRLSYALATDRLLEGCARIAQAISVLEAP